MRIGHSFAQSSVCNIHTTETNDMTSELQQRTEASIEFTPIFLIYIITQKNNPANFFR